MVDGDGDGGTSGDAGDGDAGGGDSGHFTAGFGDQEVAAQIQRKGYKDAEALASGYVNLRKLQDGSGSVIAIPSPGQSDGHSGGDGFAGHPWPGDGRSNLH